MNELQIVINQELGTISTNFEEIKESLTEQMAIYKELEVTEENKPERKKDIAVLRKISKSVDDKRKEVKVECLKPYELFEEKAKELMAIINEPIVLIDNQVKEFEDKQRLLKVSEITNHFNEIIGDLEEFIPLSKVYDVKWENISVSMKSVKEELSAKIDAIKSATTLIKNMRSEKEVQALDTLYETLDVTKAITLINNYEQQKKEIEERVKRQVEIDREKELERARIEKERDLEREREKVRSEERERIAAENRIREEERARFLREEELKKQAQAQALEIKAELGEIEMQVYVISATQEEFEQIEMYMDSIGVAFQKGE